MSHLTKSIKGKMKIAVALLIHLSLILKRHLSAKLSMINPESGTWLDNLHINVKLFLSLIKFSLHIVYILLSISKIKISALNFFT